MPGWPVSRAWRLLMACACIAYATAIQLRLSVLLLLCLIDNILAREAQDARLV